MNNERLIELQDMIYKQNKELGWHDEPRSFNTYICLFHSELSEALEGDRKGLMDDHLPQYPMCAVEIADFVIRVLDWFGSEGLAVRSDLSPPSRAELTGDLNNCFGDVVVDCIAGMHLGVSNSIDCARARLSADELEGAVGVALILAVIMDWPLEQIILEKVAYNKTRADHKRENRAKEGGKKY